MLLYLLLLNDSKVCSMLFDSDIEIYINTVLDDIHWVNTNKQQIYFTVSVFAVCYIKHNKHVEDVSL